MRNGKARALRSNPTEAEKFLWRRLRYEQVDGFKFRRQAPIGGYIVDFVCFQARLVIELDGGQHAEQFERDAERTSWLESEGFSVLRFWNNEVFDNIEGVEERIRLALAQAGESHPHPDPPPSRGRG
jgi:very-short-patch-repair endonuclease